MKQFFFSAVLTLFFLIVSAQSRSQSWSQGWQTFGQSDNGSSIKADAFGNVYATGNVNYAAGSFDSVTTGGFLAKFTSAGSLVWARKAGITCNDIAFDQHGDVYVTGYFGYNSYIGDTLPPVYGGVNSDLFVAKFDTAGNRIWVRTAGGANSENCNGITFDLNNNHVYITGSYVDTCYIGTDTLKSRGGNNTGDIFLAKYDSAGTYIWARSAGGTHDYESGQEIGTDASGNIYVTGNFYDTAYFGNITKISSGLSDIFLAKYDANGTIAWVQNNGVSFNIDYGFGLAVDATGNSFIAANYNNHAAVMRYTNAGSLQWMQEAQSGILEAAKDVALDDSGNIYITGFFQGSLSFIGSSTVFSHGLEDVFVVKFNQIGNFDWLITGGGGDYDEGNGICVDDSGHTWSTGSFIGMATFGNVTLTGLGGIYQDAYFLKSGTVITNVRAEYENNFVVVFPGPAGSQINIESKFAFHILRIIDACGKEIYKRNFIEPGINRQNIDVAGIQNGIYFYELTGESFNQRGTFSVLHE